MAKVTKVISAIGDVVGPMTSSTARINKIGLFVGAGAVGTFILEVAGQDISGPGTEEWIGQVMFTADDSTPIPVGTGLVGGANAQYAWAEVPGVSAVRARKSAGSAGSSRVTLTCTFSGGTAD